MASEEGQPFLCAICLELAYKPIVQACGHVFCFWCVHRSMNHIMHSHCSICRNVYEHFPQICGLLHRLLARLYPEEYASRAAEVREQEVQWSTFAPESSLSSEASNGEAEAVTVNDLPCEVCKKLLLRPIVLNCGHAFCQSCVPQSVLHSNIPENCGTLNLNCLKCNMVHKYPLKVCLELHDFLQRTFPEEYKRRAEEVKPVPACEIVDESVSKAGHSKAGQDETKQLGEIEIHVGAGCDQCGMYPIQGPRYRCDECPEKMGYDLCGECYELQQKGICIPGRFNQRHSVDHRMTLIKAFMGRTILVPHQWQFFIPTELEDETTPSTERSEGFGGGDEGEDEDDEEDEERSETPRSYVEFEPIN